ncbi:anhydro-N-acetylmuramic acid kinase [Bowdeniella nasicola]|nr:anhydro-N-acetylmuramic acid kinase [Bowdeniella nasicola]
MRILGMMSGTSADGIDAVVVDFCLADDHLAAEVVAGATKEFSPELREVVLAAQCPDVATSNAIADVHAAIGDVHAKVAKKFLGLGVDAICLHGQTINHRVVEGRVTASLQIGDPARVAAATNLPVIHAVRANDIALGGQGAPFAPLLDVMIAGERAPVACLNIGGIANVTVIDDRGVTAFDTGPGNCLIDAHLADISGGELSYDVDGALAARGSVDEALLAALLADPYFAQAPPKSTGREYFTLEWVRARSENKGFEPFGRLPAEDLAATLTALTARSIAEALGDVRTVYVAGGGARNRTLLRMLAERGLDVRPMSDLGLDSDLKEALLMALIGFATLHALPTTTAVAGSIALPPHATHAALRDLLTDVPARVRDAWPIPLRLVTRKDQP